jgi:GTP cyclohydrolase I
MTQKAQLGHGVDDIDNPDRVKVLGIIDKFRELGVNEDISLPQVCDHHFVKNPANMTIACGCRRSIQWQVLTT